MSVVRMVGSWLSLVELAMSYFGPEMLLFCPVTELTEMRAWIISTPWASIIYIYNNYSDMPFSALTREIQLEEKHSIHFKGYRLIEKDIFCNIFRGSLFYCCKVTKFPVPIKVWLNGSNLSTVNFYLYNGYKSSLFRIPGFCNKLWNPN